MWHLWIPCHKCSSLDDIGTIVKSNKTRLKIKLLKPIRFSSGVFTWKPVKFQVKMPTTSATWATFYLFIFCIYAKNNLQYHKSLQGTHWKTLYYNHFLVFHKNRKLHLRFFTITLWNVGILKFRQSTEERVQSIFNTIFNIKAHQLRTLDLIWS